VHALSIFCSFWTVNFPTLLPMTAVSITVTCMPAWWHSSKVLDLRSRVGSISSDYYLDG